MRRCGAAGRPPARGAPLRVLACTVALLAMAAPAQALDNGLARTPPMGFNNWNATRCRSAFNERLIKQTADLFVTSGLKRLGYRYVNLDNCWALRMRDATGSLQADPARFPSGIKAVAHYVHSKGLKIGIYTSAGTKTCGSVAFPGALDHEQQDAARFAAWGIDYVKYDNCNGQGRDAVQRYSEMRDALLATGRKIVYSICEWGQNKPWLWARDVGNSWRTTGDIKDSFAKMLAIVHRNMKLADYAGPGHWNDPDMLEVGNGGMTATEYRSHFSLWSIMAAPLLIGTDLRRATADTMKILRNSEVIAVDQDRLGRQGRPLATGGGQDVLVKPMADGSVAVALFNETAAPARIATTAAAVGLERRASYRVRDLWRHTTRETSGSIAATVRAHGTVMYRVWSDKRADRYPPLVDAAVELAASRVARAGERVRVRTTATDYGRGAAYAVTTRLHAPRGWTVSPRGSARASLRSGDALRTRWTVAVPSAAKPGTYRLTAKVVYRTRRHGGRRVSVRRALDIQLGS